MHRHAVGADGGNPSATDLHMRISAAGARIAVGLAGLKAVMDGNQAHGDTIPLFDHRARAHLARSSRITRRVGVHLLLEGSLLKIALVTLYQLRRIKIL